MYVWQVKKLLLLISLKVLTVTTEYEGDSGYHTSSMLGVGTSSSSLLEVHTCLWEKPLVSLTPLRIAEPDPHLPAWLGDTAIDFIIHFLLYTSKYSLGFFPLSPLGMGQSSAKCQPSQLLLLKQFRALETRELDEEFKFFLEVHFIFHLPLCDY